VTSSSQHRNALATDEHDAVKTGHNKAGRQPVTGRNEPRRTPESRNDRESQVGGSSQSRRRGAAA